MTGSLGCPDATRGKGSRNLEFDAQTGSDRVARLVFIAYKGPIINKGGKSVRQHRGDTYPQVEVVPVRRVVLETEFADGRIPGQSKSYSPLRVLELVHIFHRGLGNQDAKAGADGNRSVEPKDARQRVLALAVIDKFEASEASASPFAVAIDVGALVMQSQTRAERDVLEVKIIAAVHTYLELITIRIAGKGACSNIDRSCATDEVVFARVTGGRINKELGGRHKVRIKQGAVLIGIKAAPTLEISVVPGIFEGAADHEPIVVEGIVRADGGAPSVGLVARLEFRYILVESLVFAGEE